MRKVRESSPLILCVVLFTAGFIMGVLGLRVLSPDEKAELVAYLETFMRTVRNPGLEPGTIFKLSIAQNLKTALMLWGFGLAVIGAPLTCLLLLARGFAVGFGASFVTREVSTGGVAMFLSGMLPHSLIAVPTVIALSALSMSFSVALVRDRPWTYGGLWKVAGSYTWRFMLITLGLVASSLVEAYISPLLLARMPGM